MRVGCINRRILTLRKEDSVMKSGACFILGLVLLFCSNTNNANSEELRIKYKEFQGKIVEMIYDSSDGRLALRIPQEFGIGSEELNYLKKEVEFLTSQKEPLKLGTSGYTFIFKGGYPIWAPYGAWRSEGHFKCLLFAEGVTVTNNNEIHVYGEISRPSHYYPYSDNAGYPPQSWQW